MNSRPRAYESPALPLSYPGVGFRVAKSSAPLVTGKCNVARCGVAFKAGQMRAIKAGHANAHGYRVSRRPVPTAAFFNQRDSFSRYRGAALAEKCSSPPASPTNTAFETVLLCRTACPALLARCPALIAPRHLFLVYLRGRRRDGIVILSHEPAHCIDGDCALCGNVGVERPADAALSLLLSGKILFAYRRGVSGVSGSSPEVRWRCERRA